MENDAEEKSGKKLRTLGILVAVLAVILIVQFVFISKGRMRLGGGARPSAEELAKGPPLPANFDKMPPQIQEMVRRSREARAKAMAGSV